MTELLLSLELDATPHPCLSKNNRTDERTKAKHRKHLREEAVHKTKNVLVNNPVIAHAMTFHRLHVCYVIEWEKPHGSARKQWDQESALLGLVPITDGIVQAVNEYLTLYYPDRPLLNDRDVTFAPVEQEIPQPIGGRYAAKPRGRVLVEIVSLGEIERQPEPVSLTWRCQAITKKGTQCTRRAVQEFRHDDQSVHVCALHCHALAAGGAFEFEMEAVAA